MNAHTTDHPEHDEHAATAAEFDGGEATIPAGQPSAGGRLDPGAKRVLKYVAVAFGVAFVPVVALVLLAYQKKEMVAKVTLPTRAGGGQQTDVAQTDYEKGRLAEFQKQQAEAARDQGGMYVPPPSGAPTQGRPDGNAGPGASSYTPYLAQGQVAAAPGSPQDPVRQQAIQEGLNRQLAMFAGDTTVSDPVVRVALVEDPAKKAAAAQAQQPGGAAGATPTSQMHVEDPDLPGPLTIYAAQTTAPVDTGKTSYVSARLVGGKFNGAFVKGIAVLNQGEGLQITFTEMRHNGKVAKINAVALDEQTSSDALAGNVDRHILSKYVLPIAFATVSGAANAIAQRSSQIVSDGLTSSVVVPGATGRQAAAAGLASGTQIGQQVVQALSQQPNTASLPAGTTIGVLFNTVQSASSVAQQPTYQQPPAQMQQPQVSYVQQPQAMSPAPQFNLSTGMNYGTFAPTPVNQFQVRF
jgi:hypothetical protein